MASLYLHIPFCEHKCIYCDFYSIESLDPMEAFLNALKEEIKRCSSHGSEETFDTIFFGGGTPSLLSPHTIEGILQLLSQTYRVSPAAEITMEANPGTVDVQKLQGYRSAGVNRMSFGIQSFHDDELRFLTRIHSSGEARAAVHIARQAGFTNINLDLIFALPNQTLERWKANLRQAVDLGTEHISAYGLIVEHNTPLARMVNARQISPLPTETEAEMYVMTMEFLQQAGYEHYEVSNYARPGFHSRHNSNYWNHTHYLGFGPSAHSYWSGKRWWNIANIRNYCDMISAGQLPVAGEERLSGNQLLDERIMLGLRSTGVDLHRLRRDFGNDILSPQHATISRLVEDRLAVLDETSLRLTKKGFLLCDEITQRILNGLTPA